MRGAKDGSALASRVEPGKAWLRFGACIGVLAMLAVARHFLFPDVGPEDARGVVRDAGAWAPAALVGAFVVAGTLFPSPG